MKPTEAVMLKEIVRQCCPQQHFGEYTADLWYDLLDDLELSDCTVAVKALARRQPFISPAEIRAEVRKIRADRIERSVVAAPPAELTDDPRAYQRALAGNIRLAADGLAPPAERQALPAGRPTIRQDRRPASLRQALAEFRRALGPARNRVPATPQRLALEQAAESRASRPDGEPETELEAS